MSDAMRRATRRTQTVHRRRTLTIVGALAALAAIPLVLWRIDWPLSLVAAIPLAVVALYIFGSLRYA